MVKYREAIGKSYLVHGSFVLPKDAILKSGYSVLYDPDSRKPDIFPQDQKNIVPPYNPFIHFTVNEFLDKAYKYVIMEPPSQVKNIIVRSKTDVIAFGDHFISQEAIIFIPENEIESDEVISLIKKGMDISTYSQSLEFTVNKYFDPRAVFNIGTVAIDESKLYLRINMGIYKKFQESIDVLGTKILKNQIEEDELYTEPVDKKTLFGLINKLALSVKSEAVKNEMELWKNHIGKWFDFEELRELWGCQLDSEEYNLLKKQCLEGNMPLGSKFKYAVIKPFEEFEIFAIEPEPVFDSNILSLKTTIVIPQDEFDSREFTSLRKKGITTIFYRNSLENIVTELLKIKGANLGIDEHVETFFKGKGELSYGNNKDQFRSDVREAIYQKFKKAIDTYNNKGKLFKSHKKEDILYIDYLDKKSIDNHIGDYLLERELDSMIEQQITPHVSNLNMFSLLDQHDQNNQIVEYSETAEPSQHNGGFSYSFNSPKIYRFSMGCKFIDIAIDAVRLVYMPTADNFYKLSSDSIHYISVNYGYNMFSLFDGALGLVNNVAEGQYGNAIAGFIISPYYFMVLKVGGNLPRQDSSIQSIYMITTAGCILYNVASKAVELIYDLGDTEFNEEARKIRSDFVYYLQKSAHDIFCENMGVLCLEDNNEI